MRILSFIVFVLTFAISTALDGDCTVTRIANGNIKQSSLDGYFFNWRTFRYENNSNVPLETIIKNNSSVFLVCDHPYSYQGRGQGSIQISCFDGKWTPSPVCYLSTELRCPVIDENGIFKVIYKNERKVNGTARYFCKDVTKNIAGSDVRKCLSDKTWSGTDDQKCIESNVRCPQIDEKGVFIIIYSDERKVNSIARYFCDDIRSSISGSKVRICLESGEWSGPDDQRCIANYRRHYSSRVTCPIFPINDNFRVHYWRRNYVGSIAEFICNSNETSTALCLETGIWSNDPPNCSNKGCSLDSLMERLPENVVLDFSEIMSSNVSSGSEVSLHCERNLSISGNEKAKCISGTWNFGNASCIFCPKFSEDLNLEIKYSNEQIIGSTATFRCLQSFKLNGASSAECLRNGTWSHLQPSCTKIPGCSLDELIILLPRDIVPIIDSSTPSIFSEGSELQLNCRRNLILSGNEKVKCLLDAWDFGNARCIPGCRLNINAFSKLFVDPVKEYYSLGEFVQFSCPPRYKLTTDVERAMCMGSIWTNDIPECEAL